MKRLVSLLLLVVFAWPLVTEAAPGSLQAADREMKRDRYYQRSSLYERSHKLIYGENGRYGPDGRPTIAVIVNGDEDIVVEERIKSEIYSMIRQKFPREDFAVMKGNRVNTKLLQYAEDEFYEQRGTADVSNAKRKASQGSLVVLDGRIPIGAIVGIEHGTEQNGNVTKHERLDVDNLPVDLNRPRGIADLRRDDFVRAGQECGYDYVFVVTLSHGYGHKEQHNFLLYISETSKKNVWLRVRFVDVAKGDYLYRNDIVMQGKLHNGGINGHIMQRSVHKAMKEAMDDIEISYS